MRNVLKNCLIAAALVAATASTAHASNLDERERQITCLTRNIYEEARGESLVHQKIVGLITAARVADEKWPDNFCKVVYEKKQFSWTLKRKKREEKDIDTVAWTIAHMIARDIFEGLYSLPKKMKCARWYKRTDGRGVTKAGGGFFARLQPVSGIDFGAHTAYCEKGTNV
jgi:hypothetical protein